MSKWNRKLNQFLKKYTTPFTFAAGILTVLGYLAERVTNMRTATIICYLVATVLAGLPIFFRAITGLRMKAIGIEVLVSIAVFGALFIGEYSEAAIVTFLFQFGTYLEQRTLQKTRSAIRMLTEMVPATAWRLESQTAEPEEIDADEVKEDTLLLVKTGGKVAVDGIIEFGEGYLNEASINGESVPIHKVVGDQVYAGTILDSEILQMRATRVGEDTTFSKIIALVEEAQDAKSPVERFIDRFAKWYNRGTCASTHYIRVDFLEQVVLGEIHRLTKFASKYEDEFVKAVMGHSQQTVELERQKKQKGYNALLARDKEIDRLFDRMYEDNVAGKISDERFSKMTKQYEDEQSGLAGRIKTLRAELDKESRQSVGTDMFIATVRKYTRARKLTPRMLNELIDHIEVHQAEKVNGVYVQKLTIHYNCIGSIEIPDISSLQEPDVLIQTRKGVAVSYSQAQMAG